MPPDEPMPARRAHAARRADVGRGAHGAARGAHGPAHARVAAALGADPLDLDLVAADRVLDLLRLGVHLLADDDFLDHVRRFADDRPLGRFGNLDRAFLERGQVGFGRRPVDRAALDDRFLAAQLDRLRHGPRGDAGHDAHDAAADPALADLQLFLHDRKDVLLTRGLPRDGALRFREVRGDRLLAGGADAVLVVAGPALAAPLRHLLLDVDRAGAGHDLARTVEAILVGVDGHHRAAAPHRFGVRAGAVVVVRTGRRRSDGSTP
jgi:hypothetical protein